MKRSEEVYCYDGTWRGFLCCVFACFERREVPAGIQSGEAEQQSLYPARRIDTDPGRAGRVETWLRRDLGKEVYGLAREGFLTDLPEKEMHIVHLLRLACRLGALAASAHGDRSVAQLRAEVQALRSEAHLLTGFVRFTEHAGVLTSVISPKHQVLHRLGAHFSRRFPGERIVIYDDTHGLLLWCENGRWNVARGRAVFPPPGAQEEQWRALWKKFYRAVSIEGRYNPRCRATHMPKRYWNHMTEMEEEPALPCARRGSVVQ